jgi:hypothetical protein
LNYSNGLFLLGCYPACIGDWLDGPTTGCRDRTSPSDPLAARYPVTSRFVGAPSFRVARAALFSAIRQVFRFLLIDRFHESYHSGDSSVRSAFRPSRSRHELVLELHCVSARRDVMPAVVTAPTLVLRAGDSGLVSATRRFYRRETPSMSDFHLSGKCFRNAPGAKAQALTAEPRRDRE